MYYIGVDLGGTNIAVGIVNEDMEIVVKGSVPTRPERENDCLVQDMATLSMELLEKAGISLSEVAYAGIATPGSVDHQTGTVVYSNNLHFLDYPIADRFKHFLPVPAVYVENDANAAALAEALAGAAKGTKNSVMITLGTGLGGGIIIDGKIYYGCNDAGGELGHTVLVYDGRLCSCGRRGCWETYSSATGLVETTRQEIERCRRLGIPTLMIDDADKTGKISARTAFLAQKAGDARGCEVVRSYIGHLAAGITNMINIFQPEVLSIGGGVCNEGDNLLLPLVELVDREQYSRHAAKKTKLCIAKLGNDAGIIGAAGLGK